MNAIESAARLAATTLLLTLGAGAARAQAPENGPIIPVTVQFQYQYDAADRLIQARTANLLATRIEYDFAGNPIRRRVFESLPGGGGGGGGCFIATAAYGSDLDRNVETLRRFRDRHLLTNAAGRAFVERYYELSPSFAALISRDERARTFARGLLTPIVLSIEHPRGAVLAALGAALVAWRLGSRLVERLRRRLAAPTQ